MVTQPLPAADPRAAALVLTLLDIDPARAPIDFVGPATSFHRGRFGMDCRLASDEVSSFHLTQLTGSMKGSEH